MQAANLPPFQEQLKPDTTGHYRVLHNEKGGVNSIVPGLDAGDYLVNEDGRVVYKLEHNFPSNLRAPNDAELGAAGKHRRARRRTWTRSFIAPGSVRSRTAARRSVSSSTRSGEAIYLVDPGINGTHKIRPDGSTVTKFDAPKATLMSYIIKGILGHKLPWTLVLLGVMISIVLEMSGIPSLAFAVGVYLPLSSSTPIFVGGMIRWLVDRWLRRHKFKEHELTHDELVAEGDKSSGVLLASGYIAGGALAGIVIAIMNGWPEPGGDQRSHRALGDRAQSVLRRPARRSARDDSVRGSCACCFTSSAGTCSSRRRKSPNDSGTKSRSLPRSGCA